MVRSKVAHFTCDDHYTRLCSPNALHSPLTHNNDYNADEDVLDRSSLTSVCGDVGDGCSCPMELEPERDTNAEGAYTRLS